MLRKLFIRDIVLIDQLSVDFKTGLNILTGETGAGKSILLDALSLALGGRGDTSLLRRGSTEGLVVAEFDLSPDHPILDFCRSKGIHCEPGDSFILRRILTADGRSKAFLNDQPVSTGLLREAGDLLVEIHGQHDDRGLLNPKGHRSLLDVFGGHHINLNETETAFLAWRDSTNALMAVETELKSQKVSEDYDRHSLNEIQALSPIFDEEQKLAEERRLMIEGQKAAEQIEEVRGLLCAGEPADAKLRNALRRLQRMPEALKTALQPTIEALEKAASEATEGINNLQLLCRKIEFNPARLEQVEERLFSLRALARKHKCQVSELPALALELKKKLSSLDDGASQLKKLESDVIQAKKDYLQVVKNLSASRRKAALALDANVAKELGSLRLEKSKFKTLVTPLEESEYGPQGADRVEFQISTAPDAPFSPLIRIASGGELSRFILALKVVLARQGSASCLIFDEVDRGIGGAVADAVGERLTKLALGAQVLVITHSPQVAARAAHHFKITKLQHQQSVQILAIVLSATERREEIARMLSGAVVTDKARAAAESLIAGAS